MSEEYAHKATMADLYALWSIQDSLLQNYRMIFITSEAIFLSVAAAVASTKAPWLSFVIAIPGVGLMFMWTSITRSRAQHVSFVQDMIKEAERGNFPAQPLTRFKENQDLAESRRSAVAFRTHKTRRFLEVWLPRYFVLAWFLMLASALYYWITLGS